MARIALEAGGISAGSATKFPNQIHQAHLVLEHPAGADLAAKENITQADLKSTVGDGLDEYVKARISTTGPKFTSVIPACSSDEKRTRTLSLLRAAVRNLDLAAAAKTSGDAHEYWSNMYDVFGPDFPYVTKV